MSSAFGATSAPGGFLENDETAQARGLLSAAEISAFLPSRGLFTFPAPYNTQGIRLTNSGDCGGQDCVDMIYSYWRNMSNSAGSNIMYVFVGLDRNRGGQGPTLFSYDKTTDQLTEIGPLFPSSSSYSWNSGEGWYFSYGMATKLYLTDKSKLLRYDVLSHAMETVFDSTSQYPGTVIRQANSSNDDDVHSATLQDSTTYATLGCIAYKSSTRQFFYFAAQGKFDECQIDKGGRYLLIKEKLPTDTCASCDEDNVFVDLATGAQTVLMDQNGAGGHSDMGYGWYLATDNWNSYANAWRLWNLGLATPAGGLVYHDTTWSAFSPSHVSFENARADLPLSQQYACGSGASSTLAPRANEVVCFLLDSTVSPAAQQSLVVAPVMTDMNAAGGGAACPSCTAYGKDPKGNIDPTGQYFFWVSNMGGARMDAFMVKIPSQLLTGSGADTTPPTVALTSPYSGASVTGTVTLTANATDNVAVTGLQFQLDGTDLGPGCTGSPCSFDWNASASSAGSHTLSAVAHDAAGNTAGNSITVTVLALPAAISGVAAAVSGSSSAAISWSTDQPANSQVSYGTTAAYGSASPLDTALVTAHSVPLAGLAPGTTYHYQVISRNTDGIQSVSGDQTFTTPASIAASPLPATVGNWRLNSYSGNLALDSSGHNHTGTLVNQPAWGTGISGNDLGFSGSSQYVSVAGGSVFNSYPLTVSAWVKTSVTSGVHGLVNKYSLGSRNGYQVFLNGGNLCAWYFRDSADYVWDGSGCTLRTSGYADGQWHMVTFTVDRSGGKLYVDGVLKATRGWNGQPGATSTGTGLSFARYPGTSQPYLAGALDEVRVYAASLSASEVAALYTSFPRAMPAAWTALVNVTADGSSLQKTGGCDGCEDAFAASQQQLAPGASGYVEFTASETNTLRSVGLADPAAGTGLARMSYALRLQNGVAEIRELGLYKTDTPFASGDVFRIAVESGAVRYYRNGALFYSSTVTPQSALQVSASFNSLGGTVSNGWVEFP